IAHMNTMRNLIRFDWPVAVANLAFLLPVCLIPYGTAWIGVDLPGDFAWGLYSWILVASSACNVVLVMTAYRGGGRLIDGGADRRERLYRMVRAAAPGLAFGAGLLSLAV